MNEERNEQLERVAHAARCTVQAWMEDRLRPHDGRKVPLELSGLLVIVNLLRTLERLDEINEEAP